MCETATVTDAAAARHKSDKFALRAHSPLCHLNINEHKCRARTAQRALSRRKFVC